jgi:hypothetical protein
VAVYGFQVGTRTPLHGEPPARQEMNRARIGYDNTGTLRESGEHARAGTNVRLNPWMVGDARRSERRVVVRHALEDRGVNAVTRPLVVHAERLNDEQWAVQLMRPGYGALEREVEPAASGGNHPVQHVVAVASRRVGVDGEEAVG